MIKCNICSKSETKIVKTKKFGNEQLLCMKHYQQINKYGKIKERLITDKNEIIEKDDYLEIFIYNNKGNTIAVVLASKCHKDIISKYKWSLNSGYAFTNINGKYTPMHNIIAELVLGKNEDKKNTVDHKNRNKLDNRDENLRYTNQSIQIVNQGMRKNNSSGIKGVSINNGKFTAFLKYKGIKKQKLFYNLDEAIKQRKEWEEIRDRGEWLSQS